MFDGAWVLFASGSPVADGNVATGVGGVTIADFDAAHEPGTTAACK